MGPTIKLNSGYEMPQVGFGLWKVDNATAADTVYNAIKVGYRLFDGACGKHSSPSLPLDIPRTIIRIQAYALSLLLYTIVSLEPPKGIKKRTLVYSYSTI